jgi:hypothetical protein
MAWLIALVAGGPFAAAQQSVWLQNTPEPEPVVAPSAEQVEAAIRRGVDFLLTEQNANGSWGSATNTKNLNIYAPVPGAHHAFRSAVTGLAVSALLRSGDARLEVDRSIERGERWLHENLHRVRRANQDALYNVWGHAYTIEALADLIRFRPGDEAVMTDRRELIKEQIGMLARYQSINLGWGYYDFDQHTRRPTSKATSFTSATVLIALDAAKQVGVRVPEALVQGGLASIKKQQKPDFSYYYSDNGPTNQRPMRSINRPGGSLGRSQVCNLALRRWGDDEVTDRVLEVWLNRLFARNLWLDMGRKRPIPHESHFLVAGYFYYYGHWYAAACIDELPPERRQRHRDQMSRLMLDRQEKDGSWWDYPLYDYHPTYGTAMVVMTLRRCQPGTVSQGEILARRMDRGGTGEKQ